MPAMTEASRERRAPSATGMLAQRPLAHLLVYARTRRLSGLLELHADDGRGGTIVLVGGRITGVRLSPPDAYFGVIAYELGRIDAETLNATLLEIAATRRRHGELLVERGALTPAARDEILVEQVCRKVHRLFELPEDAGFAFYDDPPGAAAPSFSVDPLGPVWRGLREQSSPPGLAEVLARCASAPLRLVDEALVAEPGFAADERALLRALAERPTTLAAAKAASSLPAPRVDLLAYLLMIAKAAEPASAEPAAAAASSAAASSAEAEVERPAITKPPAGETRASMSFRVSMLPSLPSMPPPRTPSSAAFVGPPQLGPNELGAAGIARRARGLAHEGYFEALGLPEGASAEAARAAFFRLSRLWHPDKLAPELAPFRGEVAQIFAHLLRAQQTLTDPDARRAWLATHASNAPARERKDVIRDIDRALAQRDLECARSESQSLLDADADDAEAMAIVAWLRASAGEGDEDAFRAALPLLDKAVNTDRTCERASYYRGVVHKRLGNVPAAFRDFTRVVQLDPHHIDAQRELRIIEMRARKGSGEHALDAVRKVLKK